MHSVPMDTTSFTHEMIFYIDNNCIALTNLGAEIMKMKQIPSKNTPRKIIICRVGKEKLGGKIRY
jgi:hypothetical protein